MKRVSRILALASLLSASTLPLKSQEASWTWMTHLTGAGSQTALRCHADQDGNTYLLSQLNSVGTIGGEPVEVQTGNSDRFISKISPQGEPLWSISPSAPGSLGETIDAFDTDADGNIYVFISAMGFQGMPWTMQFAGLEMVAQTAVEMFVVKLDPDGIGQWYIPFVVPGVESLVIARDIVVDDQGNVYFSAAFLNGSVQVGETQLDSNGGDMFVAMCNGDGEIQWVQHMIGDSNEQFGDLAECPGSGVIYSGYWYGDTLSLGGFNLVNPDALEADNSDRFITKLESTGEVSWLVREASTSNERESSVCSTPDGGAMSLAIAESPITIGGVTAEAFNILLTRYSSTGELLWADVWDSSFPSISTRRILHANAGDGSTFYATTNFNSEFVIIDGVEIPNSVGILGTFDALLVEIDGNGNLLWYTVISGPEDEQVYGVDQAPDGSIRLCGNFNSESLTLGDLTLVNAEAFSNDSYLARLDFVTNVELIETEEVLLVYPSPTNSSLNMETSLPAGETIQVFISDLNGSVVYQEQMPASELNRIDVSKLAPGMYLLHVQGSEHKWGKRFVKE